MIAVCTLLGSFALTVPVHAAVAIALDHFKLDANRDHITYVQSGTMTTRIAGIRAGSIDATVVDPGFVPFLVSEGFKDLGYLGEFGIPYQHESLDSSKAFLAKNRPTALNAVKGIIEGIAFIAQERNAPEVKRVLAKYLKFKEQAQIDDAYTSLRGYAVAIRKPYPTDDGVDSLIKFLAKFNPKVANMTVKDASTRVWWPSSTRAASSIRFIRKRLEQNKREIFDNL